jgi:hypothetical protein
VSAIRHANGRKVQKRFQKDIIDEEFIVIFRPQNFWTSNFHISHPSLWEYRRISQEAIGLKKMMGEHGLYDCFWIEYGEKFNHETMECGTDDLAGTVFMCTFPGLIRTVKDDNNTKKIVIVKAEVVLESSKDIAVCYSAS